MIKRKKCSEEGCERPVWARKKCKVHDKGKPKKSISKVKKNYGEKLVFEMIWNERPHVCFVSGRTLNEEAKAHYFAHVLSKGLYPKFRLLKENIVLLHEDYHYAFDFQSEAKQRELPGDWDKLYELREKLKQKYNG